MKKDGKQCIKEEVEERKKIKEDVKKEAMHIDFGSCLKRVCYKNHLLLLYFSFSI